jgi:hypothetical protein
MLLRWFRLRLVLKYHPDQPHPDHVRLWPLGTPCLLASSLPERLLAQSGLLFRSMPDAGNPLQPGSAAEVPGDLRGALCER